MSKPVIAVDFDDVVGSFNAAYIHHQNIYYGGRKITYEQAYTYDMPRLYGISSDVLVERVRNFCHHHHDEIEALPGIYRALDRLSYSHRIELVTSRCESLRKISLDWLEKHQLKSFFKDFHFTNGFGSLFTTKRMKSEVCREIGAQLLIEDEPPNATDVAESGIPVLLMDHPWNQEVTHPLITRINDWPDIIQQIEAMSLAA